MPRVRWEPFSGDPVLVAPRRADRPHDTGRHAGADVPCPFCEGNEHMTTSEVYADRPTGTQPDAPGWRVRAFPNKYPVMNPRDGVHEVVVTAPRHVTSLAELTQDEARRAVTAWAVRLEQTALDARGLWPFLFLNQGAPAGASLEHSHAQVVGLPFGPPRLVRRDMTFQTAPSCPLCLDLAGPGDRLVLEADGLVAWCPEIPPLSGCVRIAPRRHVPAWTDVLDPGAVARMVRTMAVAIRAATGVPDLNLWLHQDRPGGGGRFHWHIEMVGRVGTLAGLELGAGVFAVTRDPADYAERLRAELPAPSPVRA